MESTIDLQRASSAELAIWCAGAGVRFTGASGVRELPARFKVPHKKASKKRAIVRSEAEDRALRELKRLNAIKAAWEAREAMPDEPMTLAQCPMLRFARLVKVGAWWMPPRNVRPHVAVVGVRWTKEG